MRLQSPDKHLSNFNLLAHPDLHFCSKWRPEHNLVLIYGPNTLSFLICLCNWLKFHKITWLWGPQLITAILPPHMTKMTPSPTISNRAIISILTPSQPSFNVRVHNFLQFLSNLHKLYWIFTSTLISITIMIYVYTPYMKRLLVELPLNSAYSIISYENIIFHFMTFSFTPTRV